MALNQIGNSKIIKRGVVLKKVKSSEDKLQNVQVLNKAQALLDTLKSVKESELSLYEENSQYELWDQVKLDQKKEVEDFYKKLEAKSKEGILNLVLGKVPDLEAALVVLNKLELFLRDRNDEIEKMKKSLQERDVVEEENADLSREVLDGKDGKESLEEKKNKPRIIRVSGSNLVKLPDFLTSQESIPESITSFKNTILDPIAEATLEEERGPKKKNRTTAEKRFKAKVVFQERLLEMAKEFDFSFVNPEDPKVNDFLFDSEGNDCGTLLHESCKKGKADFVKELIKGKARLDEVDAEGYLAILHACKVGKLEVVESLISAGAKTDVRNKESKTLLHILTESSPVKPNENEKLERGKIGDLLIEKIDTSAVDRYSKLAVDYLEGKDFSELREKILSNLRKVNAEKVKELNDLMNAGGVSDLIEDYKGRSLSDEELTKISEYFAPGAKDHLDQYALLFVVSSGLLLCEEDGSRFNKESRKALLRTYQGDEAKTVFNNDFLTNDKALKLELEKQKERLTIAVVKDLIASGLDVTVPINESKNCETTYLNRFCARGNFSAAQVVLGGILESSVEKITENLNTPNSQDGLTPLHYCATLNNSSSVLVAGQILQSNKERNLGLKIDEKDCRGQTPLATAMYLNSPKMVELLMGSGADLKNVDVRIRKSATKEVKEAVASGMRGGVPKASPDISSSSEASQVVSQKGEGRN